MDQPHYLNSGLSSYRKTNLSSTDQQIKAKNGNIYGFTFINPNTDAVYVKFYDALAADTTVGTTVPFAIIGVPAGDGDTPGQAILTPGSDIFRHFSTALTIACVAELADTGTTAPSTAVYVEVVYR